MSGAYVADDLASEFGKLPPALLPVKNRRLLELQLQSFDFEHDQKYITIPQDYPLAEADQDLLQRAEISAIPADPKVSAKTALLAAVSEILARSAGPIVSLTLVLGDTLHEYAPFPDIDSYAVGTPLPEYKWSIVDIREGQIAGVSEERHPAAGDQVLTGYFTFKHIARLVRELNRNKSLTSALSAYAAAHLVAPQRMGEWHDFGHLHTYFRARMEMTDTRSFNEFATAGRVLTKSSSREGRIDAEASWFESLPAAMRIYVPQFMGRSPDRTSYSLEYLYLSPLSDLYVFGELTKQAWANILDAVCQFVEDSRQAVSEDGIPSKFVDEYRRKGYERLAEFAAQGGDVDRLVSVNGAPPTSLRKMHDALCALLEDRKEVSEKLSHGDLCLSNILYDFRTRGVRLIDPRGSNLNGEVSLYSDELYDLAKLNHSFIGGYDLILAGRYALDRVADDSINFRVKRTPSQEAISNQFRGLVRERFAHEDGSGDLRVLDAVTALLFISMLPLHSDRPDRQLAFQCVASEIHSKIVLGQEGWHA
ncbi:hypothetical protein GCM10012276_38160 [Nocardioides deserti]|nr:hypothetical protein GCM10012276_38160 [Nocardioides deserti]